MVHQSGWKMGRCDRNGRQIPYCSSTGLARQDWILSELQVLLPDPVFGSMSCIAEYLLGASGYLWLRKSPCWFKPPGLFTVCYYAYNTAHLFPCLSGSLFCHLNVGIMSPFRVTLLERLHGVQPGLFLPGQLTGVCLLEYCPTGPWLSVGLSDSSSLCEARELICHNMPGLGTAMGI